MSSSFLGRRQHRHGKELGPTGLAEPAQQIEAAEAWQIQVQKDDLRLHGSVPSGVGSCAKEVVEGLCAVACDDDLVQDVVPLERAKREQFVVLIVLDEQYGLICHHE